MTISVGDSQGVELHKLVAPFLEPLLLAFEGDVLEVFWNIPQIHHIFVDAATEALLQENLAQSYIYIYDFTSGSTLHGMPRRVAIRVVLARII